MREWSLKSRRVSEKTECAPGVFLGGAVECVEKYVI